MRFGYRRMVLPLLAPVVLAAGACGLGRDGERGGSGRRAFLELDLRTLWSVGGAEYDTTVLMPAEMAADSHAVYVLEPALHRVSAIRLRDGALLWRTKGEGSGPEEFRNPTAIAFAPDGGLLVADHGNGRIATMDAAGRVTGHIGLTDIGVPVGLCAFGDGTILVSALGNRHPLWRIGRNGTVVERPALPWSDLAPGETTLPFQGFFAPDPRTDGCVFTLRYGRGFARFRGSKPAERMSYIEWFDLPGSTMRSAPGKRAEELGDRTEASRGVAADSQTIAVGFVGRSDDGGRLIDLYDARTGDYRSTLRAPFWFDRMTRSGSVYLFMTRVDDYPVIVAVEAVEVGGR